MHGRKRVNIYRSVMRREDGQYAISNTMNIVVCYERAAIMDYAPWETNTVWFSLLGQVQTKLGCKGILSGLQFHGNGGTGTSVVVERPPRSQQASRIRRGGLMMVSVHARDTEGAPR